MIPFFACAAVSVMLAFAKPVSAVTPMLGIAAIAACRFVCSVEASPLSSTSCPVVSAMNWATTDAMNAPWRIALFASFDFATPARKPLNRAEREM
ncbi:hypothetical protein CAL14_08570 [Bordetella genomosp. 9]|nr:hypothetical protein CAL14_08570 [Bordetella genomosp. 9]